MRWEYKFLIVAMVVIWGMVGLVVAGVGLPTYVEDTGVRPSADDVDTKHKSPDREQGMSIKEADSIYYRCIEGAGFVASIMSACEAGWINNVGFDVWNKDPSIAPWE